MTAVAESASSVRQGVFAFYNELDTKGHRTFWARYERQRAMHINIRNCE